MRFQLHTAIGPAREPARGSRALALVATGSRIHRAGMLEHLIAALRALAADPDTQVQQLDAFRQVAGEVRDGVRDMVPVDDQLQRQGQLPDEAASRVRELDACFDRMVAAGEPMFTAEAVRSAPEWTEARQLARRALEALTKG